MRDVLASHQLPAQLFDQTLGVFGDFPREVNCVDTFEYQVVGLHRVGAGERRAEREERDAMNTAPASNPRHSHKHPPIPLAESVYTQNER